MERIEKEIASISTIVEKELESVFSCENANEKIINSMKYSIFSGGKRIRPFLVLESYRLFADSDDFKKAIPYAVALECIHTYSLIHDDLPCMDNDDYRRGKPTSHKVYGEAQAVLTGDSLLTYTFDIAANNKYVSDKSKVLAIKAISYYAGFMGMVGGQIIDMNEDDIHSFDDLKKMYSLKTSALLQCACLLGYYAYTDSPDKITEKNLCEFADKIGIAFQIKDDILDVVSTNEELGKPIGSDIKNNKITALTYLSIEQAQLYVSELTEQAKKIIMPYIKSNSVLPEYADYLVKRKK